MEQYLTSCLVGSKPLTSVGTTAGVAVSNSTPFAGLLLTGQPVAFASILGICVVSDAAVLFLIKTGENFENIRAKNPNPAKNQQAQTLALG